MFRCDGLECRGDPYYIIFIGVEYQLSKFLRFRQVGRIFP